MHVKTEDGTVVRNPDSADLKRLLSTINEKDNTFLILDRSDTEFLQLATSTEGGYVVEYQESGTHYQTVHPVAYDQLWPILTDYVAGDALWMGAFEWQEVDLDNAWGSSENGEVLRAPSNMWTIALSIIGVGVLVAATMFNRVLGAFLGIDGDTVIILGILVGLSLMLPGSIEDFQRWDTLSGKRKAEAIGIPLAFVFLLLLFLFTEVL